MTKQTKSYRGIEENLIKGVQHLAIDKGRTEGDLVNEALMLLLKAHEKKKKAKQQKKSSVDSSKGLSEMETIENEINNYNPMQN